MTNKTWYKTIGLSYIGLAIIVTCTYMSCGCNIQKKAEARVLSNETSFNKIGVKWSKVNPCRIDTAFVAGKSDTTISYDTIAPEYIPYTPYINFDSVYSSPFVFPEQPKKANVTKTVTIHDTSLRYLKDVRELNDLKTELENSAFNLKVMTNDRDTWKHKAEERFKWLFILIGVVIVYELIRWKAKPVIASSKILSTLKGLFTGI